MKKKTLRNKRASLLLLALLLTSCFSSADKVFYKRAVKAKEKEKYEEAISFYQKVLDVNESSDLILKSAQDGAFIARTYTKDFNSLIRFLRVLILHSDNSELRVRSQREIADIYFDKLANYTQAIDEYSRLLVSGKESPEIRLNIARSYYYLGQFDQAMTELEDIKLQEEDRQNKFDLLFLKASIWAGMKNVNEAVKIYDVLLKDYPKKSASEHVAINMAVVLEEQKDFDRAIEVLTKLGSTDPTQQTYVEMKIERLKEIKKLQPGARGFRK